MKKQANVRHVPRPGANSPGVDMIDYKDLRADQQEDARAWISRTGLFRHAVANGKEPWKDMSFTVKLDGTISHTHSMRGLSRAKAKQLDDENAKLFEPPPPSKDDTCDIRRVVTARFGL